MSKESEPCMRRHKLVREYLANAVHNYPEPPVPVDDIEGEKWKEISGTNGLYFISDIGRFKTKVLGFEYHFCLLEPLPNANGRLTIKIKYTPGFTEKKFVDRLVLQCFYPCEIPDQALVIHKDDDSFNCSLENLEWNCKG